MERDAGSPVLQPVLTYTLEPGECDIHKCLVALRELEDEDPLLHVVWQSRLEEVHLQLMGAVQLEIVRRDPMHDRFGLDVTFGPGSILYKETIAAPVEGVGHFEPLRHYAETHVLLEPLPQGAGMAYATVCSEDVLDRNWQRLIMQHFQEREHLGVLTGSRIDRYENHAADRPCASEAHGRRRFPPSHLPRDTPGPDGSEEEGRLPSA